MLQQGSAWAGTRPSLPLRITRVSKSTFRFLRPPPPPVSRCSNMAKAGMNPKTLQYLMGHSDIGVTMNTYTHLGLEDAKEEMIRMEELNAARAELNKTTGEKPVTQKMFRAI